MEQWSGGRPSTPVKDAQATDVRSRKFWPVTEAGPLLRQLEAFPCVANLVDSNT